MTPHASSQPRRGRLLYEGRSKRVFETSNPDLCILEFKTEFPAADGGARTHPSRARCNVDIAQHVFQYLGSFRIPHHFVEVCAESELLVRRLEMIPVAVVVRNMAFGKLCERYGVEEGRELDVPVIELLYRSHQHDYPLVNETHILAFGVSTPEEIRTMIRIATKTNAVLRSFMERRRVRLVDCWLEFGRQQGEVVLGDAITPEALRILDPETGFVHDGTMYRLGIGNFRDQYLDLHKRFTT